MRNTQETKRSDGWIRSRKCENGLMNIVLAGLRKPWTISSAIIVKVFHKVASGTKYLYPVVPSSLGQNQILQACRFPAIFLR
jgi:hypothetical protein